MADNVFSNAQQTRNPVLKLCRLRTTDDLSQSTFYVQNFFLEALPLQPRSERSTATTLWFSMARATVASRSFSTFCSPVWIPRKIIKQADQIFRSSSPKLVEVSDARATGRKSLSWIQSTLALICHYRAAYAAAGSFIATLFAGVDLQSSDGRGVSTQLLICADALLFLLNEWKVE